MSFSRVIFFFNILSFVLFKKKNSMTVVTPTYPSQFFKLESFGLISKSNVCRKNHTGIGRSKQLQGKLNCMSTNFISSGFGIGFRIKIWVPLKLLWCHSLRDQHYLTSYIYIYIYLYLYLFYFEYMDFVHFWQWPFFPFLGTIK